MIIPLQKPLHPTTDKIIPYLHKIDTNRFYTNQGPLVCEYEARIGNMFKCHVAACSSATMGMVASLMAMAGHELDTKDLDVWMLSLPSWTFVATANAVRLAGANPFFVGIEDPCHISVSNFGNLPIEYDGQAIMADAAGAFDSILDQGTVHKKPIIISTHATKCFSTGEGGLVLSTDQDFIDRVKVITNHGINKSRNVLVSGLNAKMSEYHAAVGLASLDEWKETREKWMDAEIRYAKHLGRVPRPYASSLYPVTINKSVIPVIKDLNDRGIVSKQVWGTGVHNYPAYKDCPRTNMEKTEDLADKTLFLPFYLDISDSEMNMVAEEVGDIMDV